MTCAKMHALLSAFVDDELTPREKAEVSAHLDACDGCRQALGQLRATSQLLRDLPHPTAPPHLTDSALALVRARMQSQMQSQMQSTGAHSARAPFWAGPRACFDALWRRFELRALAVAAAIIAVLILGAQIARQNLPSSAGGTSSPISASLAPPHPASGTPELAGFLRVDNPQAIAGAVQRLLRAQHGKVFTAARGDGVAVDALVPRRTLATIESDLAKLGSWQVLQRESGARRDAAVRIRIVPRHEPP